MATAVAPTPAALDADSRSDAARRYPPLLFLVVAIGLALAVLPSALTLPQSNPTQTVEIAPVPPDDDVPPQPGNLSTLALGESESVQGGGALGGDEAQLPDLPPPPPPPAAPLGGQGKTQATKRCAQTSQGLRQTEDITSPPCVAFFEGDNGGATYQGVTDKEIKILIYAEGGIISTPTARGTDNFASNTLIDLDAPPQANETGDVITLRSWFQYFNDRYQLYGRRAHGYIYYSSGSPWSQQQRQADAAQAFSLVKPFATVSFASYGGSPDAYLRYMAQRGVLNFGSVQGRPQAFFQQFPKLIWGYPPSLEQQSKLYADYICTKVANRPAGGAGGALANQPRKYGLIYTSDANYPNLQAAKAEVVRLLKDRCGITFADEATYPNNGFAIDPVTDPTYANEAMARFSQKGITTIIWPGGIETNFSVAASRTIPAPYQPEWFLMGDGQNDAAGYAVVQEQSTWERAWVVTPRTKFKDLETEICYQQYRSVDRVAQNSDVQNFACEQYNDLRQLFSGIQVAGPRLGPTSIDRGYHAIPAVESPDPRVAACFYEPGDYTCVKDAQAMWYDPRGQVSSQQQPGCWRMVNNASRHIFGKWPTTAPQEDKKPGVDECNEYDTSQNINNDPDNTG
ncbi:MAG TPA: hypothetical protein VM345_11115 [Acidimicrobiales bacterium]|nr:hypothetical protein [Acidimicrobiales bacterium]